MWSSMVLIINWLANRPLCSTLYFERYDPPLDVVARLEDLTSRGKAWPSVGAQMIYFVC